MSGRVATTARLAVGAVAVLALAGACSSSSDTSTGGSSSAAATTAAATTAAAASPTEALPSDDGSSQPAAAGNGCVKNNGKIPAGAHTVATADLDLDGTPDTLFLVDVAGKRTLGVKTATGAVFSTTFQSAAPQQASAIGQKMDPAGPSIVLLNTGRSVELYDVVDCQLVASKNVQGAQYTFDLGFTGFGTGVECVRNGAGYTLAGLLAKPESTGNTFTVYRTNINLSDFGHKARNGTRQTLATHAGSSNSQVQQARTVSCGSSKSVTEPAA